MIDWRRFVGSLYQPPASVGLADTSLRFTDILFGFVIRELFIRLQYFGSAPCAVQAQLVAATTLVLGSWIGYRRSLNRSSYEVKFFNLPFFKFLADQGMLIFYFRIATLVPLKAFDPDGKFPDDGKLASETLSSIGWIFLLYIVWDGLGVWESLAKRGGKFLYSKIVEKKQTEERQPANFAGLAITIIIAGAVFFERVLLIDPTLNLWALTVTLVLYRYLKEVRSTWQASHQ